MGDVPKQEAIAVVLARMSNLEKKKVPSLSLSLSLSLSCFLVFISSTL